MRGAVAVEITTALTYGRDDQLHRKPGAELGEQSPVDIAVRHRVGHRLKASLIFSPACFRSALV
jgi:hypothetical protein